RLGGSHDDVGKAVAVHVPGAGDGKTELVPGGNPDQGEIHVDIRIGAAQIDEGFAGVGSVGVVQRHAHDDVAEAIAVHVARAGDGPAKLVTRGTPVDGHVHDAVRDETAVEDLGASGICAAGIIVRRADDHVG